jgi:hypothetical protein
MKKETAIIINIMFWIFCFGSGNLWGVSQEIPREKIEQVMEKYGYDNWEVGDGKVTPGVKISENVLQKFARTTMKSAWKKDIYNTGKVRGTPHSYSFIRKYWKSEDKNSFLDVTMVVSPTPEAAKKYLILRYAGSQMGPNLIRPAGRDIGIDLGSVCFVTRTKELGSLSSIDFIRNNVVIMIRAEGSFRTELETMARELDALLMQEPHADNYSQLKQIPTITRFSCERITIKLGDTIPLHLEVKNPKQRELRYIWKISGGGVEDHKGNFFYYGGEAGKHTVTVTVLDDEGLQHSKSIEIEVMR